MLSKGMKLKVWKKFMSWKPTIDLHAVSLLVPKLFIPKRVDGLTVNYCDVVFLDWCVIVYTCYQHLCPAWLMALARPHLCFLHIDIN